MGGGAGYTFPFIQSMRGMYKWLSGVGVPYATCIMSFVFARLYSPLGVSVKFKFGWGYPSRVHRQLIQSGGSV